MTAATLELNSALAVFDRMTHYRFDTCTDLHQLADWALIQGWPKLAAVFWPMIFTER